MSTPKPLPETATALVGQRVVWAENRPGVIEGEAAMLPTEETALILGARWARSTGGKPVGERVGLVQLLMERADGTSRWSEPMAATDPITAMPPVDTGPAEPTWRAVIADRDGFVMADEQIALWCSGMTGEYARHYGDSEPRDLYVVTGAALPEPQSQRPDETFFRMPNPLTLDDVLYQVDVYDEEPDEILRQWKRAVDTVAAMNAAGVQ